MFLSRCRYKNIDVYNIHNDVMVEQKRYLLRMYKTVWPLKHDAVYYKGHIKKNKAKLLS